MEEILTEQCAIHYDFQTLRLKNKQHEKVYKQHMALLNFFN